MVLRIPLPICFLQGLLRRRAFHRRRLLALAEAAHAGAVWPPDGGEVREGLEARQAEAFERGSEDGRVHGNR